MADRGSGVVARATRSVAPAGWTWRARRCGETGKRLWKSAEVDHRVPLFRVWSEYHDLPWPKLLDFWALPNLQVINRDVHAAKCANEARERRAAPSPEAKLN
jgi:hypothetical protein